MLIFRGVNQNESYDICWVVPLPSNSDHQDYEPFLVGNPELNLHFHYYWEGGQPKIYVYKYMSWYHKKTDSLSIVSISVGAHNIT